MIVSSNIRMTVRWRSLRPRLSPLLPDCMWLNAGPTRSVVASTRALTAPRCDAHCGARPRSGARHADSAGGGQPSTRSSGSPAVSSRRRHPRFDCDWSSDVCSSDLAEWVLARVGFDAALAKAQLVITGEGSFDKTSLVGKASGEVVRRAQAAKTRVAVVAGKVEG